MVLGERVVDVVVVGVDRVDVSGAVDGDVDELVAVADGRVRVDVDRIVDERLSAVGRDGHVDAVVVAGARNDAQLGCARRLRCGRDRRVRLVDDVRPWIDREVADRVLRDLERVGRVDRRRELAEEEAGVGAATDGDPLRGVVVADAHLVVGVGGDPFAIVGRLRRGHRLERPGGATVGRGGDVDVREREAGSIHVVEAGRVLVRRDREVGVPAAGSEAGVVRLRDAVR